jgi:hypothetical protein
MMSGQAEAAVRIKSWHLSGETDNTLDRALRGQSASHLADAFLPLN